MSQNSTDKEIPSTTKGSVYVSLRLNTEDTPKTIRQFYDLLEVLVEDGSEVSVLSIQITKKDLFADEKKEPKE